MMVFPTVGKGGKSWTLSMAKFSEYQDAFPGVAVGSELKSALQWIRDNPTRRKTAKGMPAFLTRWLGKCQNRVSGGVAAPQRFERQGFSSTIWEDQDGD